MTDDDFEAQLAAFTGEVEFYFPDSTDAFENALARLLGLKRPGGLTLRDWRRMRVAYIEEHPEDADRLCDEAASLAEEFMAERVSQWPY